MSTIKEEGETVVPKTTRKRGQRVGTKKSGKDFSKDSDVKTENENENEDDGDRSFVEDEVKTDTLKKEVEINVEEDKNFKFKNCALGYTVNTFLYFLSFHVLAMVFEKMVSLFLKISNYECSEILTVSSVKTIVVLFCWYKFISGGYDGDPFFQIFRYKLRLINKKEAMTNFACSVLGAMLFWFCMKAFGMIDTDSHLSNIIVEYIQKNKINRNKSFLTAFVYPHLPPFLRHWIMSILINSCPYRHIGNKHIDRVFMSNTDLYSSIVMDFFLSEFICSFFNYVALYVYVFTKNNLSHSLITNLTATQLVFIFGNKYSKIVGGPFMNLNWILYENLQRKTKCIFIFFLIISHFFGFFFAICILKKPTLSLTDAKKYYRNVDTETLRNYMDKDEIVNIASISNEQIRESDFANTILGRLLKKFITQYWKPKPQKHKAD